MSDMRSTVFFAPDLHKRYTDFNSIRGYVEAVEQVQLDIIEYLKSVENPIFISMGDWYDSGYRSTGRVLSDTNLDREISRVCDGEAYICLGNHFFLERDSNPEMYIIQPNDVYKPKIPVQAVEPIFKLASGIRIGNVLISLFHFDKLTKNYYAEREPWVKFHVGVYHDECTLPSDIRQQAGYFGTTSNEYLNNIYSNVDLALHGHIHVTCGHRTLVLNSTGRSVPLYIPGSLAITQNKDIEKHMEVKCPVLTIDDSTDEVLFTTHTISTHMELLQFYNVREKKLASDVTDTMGTGSASELIMPNIVTLRDFLRSEGYSENETEMILNIREGKTDILSIATEVRKWQTQGRY